MLHPLEALDDFELAIDVALVFNLDLHLSIDVQFKVRYVGSHPSELIKTHLRSTEDLSQSRLIAQG